MKLNLIRQPGGDYRLSPPTVFSDCCGLKPKQLCHAIIMDKWQDTATITVWSYVILYQLCTSVPICSPSITFFRLPTMSMLNT